MKKQTFIIISVFSIIMIFIVTLFIVKNPNYHKQISNDEIKIVTAWSYVDNYHYQLNDEEIKALVAVFNASQLNKSNDDFAGITPSYGIQVTLSSGETLTINEADSPYGNIEVQRNIAIKHVSYWIKGQELYAFMRKVCFPK